MTAEGGCPLPWATSLPAASGGVKGKRSVRRGRQDASLLCQAKRLPGTASGEGVAVGDGRGMAAGPTEE